MTFLFAHRFEEGDHAGGIDAPSQEHLQAGLIGFQLMLAAKTHLRHHLRRLDASSRANRFGGGVSDEFIENYATITIRLNAVVHGFFVEGIMRGAAEVITCDNTEYDASKADTDRLGLMFSVPLYGPEGALKGAITAVIRTNALRTLLPERDAALVNVGNGVVADALKAGQQQLSRQWVQQGRADPSLLFSTSIPVAIDDRGGQWLLWVGHAKEDFLDSHEATAIHMIRYIGFGICGFMTLVGVLMSRVIRRRRSAELTKLNTELADNVRKLEAVNAHATSLNVELLAKMAELKAAQDDIVKKGKLAQLGQLTATVAHEIRNPLGAIKTSTQLVERKVRDKNLGLEKLLERINNGVSRCDQIITELLDFARSRSLQVRSAGIDATLARRHRPRARRPRRRSASNTPDATTGKSRARTSIRPT